MDYINEKEYIKGFNHAAILSDLRPELLSDIIPSLNPSNSYFEGFFDAKEQYELNNTVQNLDELENLRQSNDSREIDFERER